MNDILRTRIAAAMERNLAEQLFSDLPDRYYKWIGYDELADAVIRELGLEPERRIGPGEPGEGLSGYIRYVTEWRVDD